MRRDLEREERVLDANFCLPGRIMAVPDICTTFGMEDVYPSRRWTGWKAIGGIGCLHRPVLTEIGALCHQRLEIRKLDAPRRFVAEAVDRIEDGQLRALSGGRLLRTNDQRDQ